MSVIQVLCFKGSTCNVTTHPSTPSLQGEGVLLIYRPIWFLSSFGLKKGVDFDHFSLKLGMFFTLAWHWVFCLQGIYYNIFLHQHWQICSPSQIFMQMRAISG